MPIEDISRNYVNIEDIKKKTFHEITWSEWATLVDNHNGLCKEIDALVERLENLENFVKGKNHFVWR